MAFHESVVISEDRPCHSGPGSVHAQHTFLTGKLDCLARGGVQYYGLHSEKWERARACFQWGHSRKRSYENATRFRLRVRIYYGAPPFSNPVIVPPPLLRINGFSH